jgi:hypothetical protein
MIVKGKAATYSDNETRGAVATMAIRTLIEWHGQDGSGDINVGMIHDLRGAALYREAI